MTSQEKALSTVAGVLLAASVFSSFAMPALGVAFSVSALTLAIYLKRRGAFRDDNTPLLGALLIGGAGIMVVGGVLGTLGTVSVNAMGILFLALLAPPFLFLLVLGARERWRAFSRNVGLTAQDDNKPPQ